MSKPGESDALLSVQGSKDRKAPTLVSPALFVAKVVVVLFACVGSTSLILSYPSLMGTMIEAGLFASYCPKNASGHFTTGCAAQNNMQNCVANLLVVTSSISACVMFFSGNIFDRFGPSHTAWAGAGFCATGFLLLYCSLLAGPKTNWLAFIALPLSDFGSFTNSMSLLGFMWHYPQHQALIIGISSASYQIGAANAYLFFFLMTHHLSIDKCLLIIGGVGILGGAVASWFSPPQSEFFEMADRALGTTSEPSVANPFGQLKLVFKALGLYASDNISMILSIALGFVFLVYWQSTLLPYSIGWFGEAQGNSISDLFGLLSALLGSAVYIFGGAIFDRFGVRVFVGLLTCAIAVVASFLFVPLYWAQMVTLAAGPTAFTSLFTLMNKWGAMYAPPEVFGTTLGTIGAILGASQFINFGVTPLAGMAHGQLQFIYPYAVMGGLTFLAFVHLLVRLLLKPTPATPPTLAEVQAGRLNDTKGV